MPERIDYAEAAILRDKGTDDARRVPGALATLRNRAHSCLMRAERETDPERRAEHEARAVMFRGRADCLEGGRPIPLEWQTPSERLEAAVRAYSEAGLALALELGEGEMGDEGSEPADAFEGGGGSGPSSSRTRRPTRCRRRRCSSSPCRMTHANVASSAGGTWSAAVPAARRRLRAGPADRRARSVSGVRRRA